MESAQVSVEQVAVPELEQAAADLYLDVEQTMVPGRELVARMNLALMSLPVSLSTLLLFVLRIQLLSW